MTFLSFIYTCLYSSFGEAIRERSRELSTPFVISSVFDPMQHPPGIIRKRALLKRILCLPQASGSFSHMYRQPTSDVKPLDYVARTSRCLSLSPPPTYPRP